jgi:hypothetical protein
MSQENVEIVRRAFEADQQGEYWADALHPEVEWDYSAYPGLDLEVQGRAARATFDCRTGTVAPGSATRQLSKS